VKAAELRPTWEGRGRLWLGTIHLTGFALTDHYAERRLSLVFTEDSDRYGTQLASGRVHFHR